MSDGKKENSKHRNHKGKTRADNFSTQMNELKEIVRKELSRGAQIAEVEKKLDGKIDKIVSEVRDYEKLEHIIEAKAKDAVSAVDKRMGVYVLIFSGLIFIAGVIGWEYLINKSSELAIEGISKTASHQTILHVVSNQVSKAQNDIESAVAKEIGSLVSKEVGVHTRIFRDESEKTVSRMRDIKSQVDVMSIIFAARANSREHYDQLLKLSSDTNKVVEARIAKDAIKAIEETYKQRKYSFDYYRPGLKMNDGRKLETELLIKLVRADNDWNCDGAIGELARLNRKEFVATMIHAVQYSKRIDTVYLAITYIEKLTGKSFQPLGITEVLEWWKVADKDKQYHSQYEWYCDMTDKIIGNNSVNSKKSITELIAESQQKKETDPSFKIASKLIIHLITLFPDFEAMLKDGRQELYRNALKDLEGSQFQDSSWYVNNAYFLCLTDKVEFYKYVEERLKDHPGFEEDLKRSSLFTDAFFESEHIKWPSKLPPEQRRQTPMPDVLTIPLNRTRFVFENAPQVQTPKKRQINSQNAVGFFTVEIKKGIRELTELPTNGTVCAFMQKLGDLKSGVCKGDSISWTISDVSYRFKSDGLNWLDANTNKVEDVIIPSGATRITYDRTKDEESSITFTVATEVPSKE